MSVVYDCRWSNELDDRFIDDFCAVERQVFGSKYSEKTFQKKYIRNPYGPSVVVVVYMEQKPVAARALWRNDIEGRMAFQPCDTCVMEACRGKGIFSEMTARSMAMLPESAMVYNFPNLNSRPGYMKMGWQVHKRYRECLLLSLKKYLKLHPLMMDDLYFDWWVNKETHYAKKMGGRYFLVSRSKSKSFLYFVRAEISERAASSLRKAGMGLFFYKDEKRTFYNKSLPDFWIVSKGQPDVDIPSWKMDVV